MIKGEIGFKKAKEIMSYTSFPDAYENNRKMWFYCYDHESCIEVWKPVTMKKLMESLLKREREVAKFEKEVEIRRGIKKLLGIRSNNEEV
jgi:hypothetical protein